MKHLAWLVRTNTVSSYVHFINDGQHLLSSICQYGNLPISTMNKKSDKQFREEVSNTRFEYTNREDCGSQFSTDGIKGRKFLEQKS